MWNSILAMLVSVAMLLIHDSMSRVLAGGAGSVIGKARSCLMSRWFCHCGLDVSGIYLIVFMM